MRMPSPSYSASWPVSCLYVLLLISPLRICTSAGDPDGAVVELDADTADQPPNCDCIGCPNEETIRFGLHKDILSEVCPEGSVATIIALRTADTRSKYDLVVKNAHDGSDYVYRQVSREGLDTTCYEAPPEHLPVVGDQDQIEVVLNCEAVTCDFLWDVEFGCQELGVLTTAAGGGVQVLSDVDDTITCANPSSTCDSLTSCLLEGGSAAKVYLSGADRRLEHKEMYPGVAELYLGLALGPSGGQRWEGREVQYAPTKPMMLSARPREAEFALAIDQASDLNVYMENAGDRLNFTYWGVNTDGSMYGTLFDGNSFKEFGQTKAKHYNTLSDSRPNTRFAFVADNGQGDQCGAQSMLESPNGERLDVVLIHEVIDPEDVWTQCEQPQGGDFNLDLPESDRVHYFRTHSDAAIWTLERNLISCCSASTIYNAVNEFIECRCDDNTCPTYGLNTGFTEAATRNETLVYCKEIKADQEFLLNAIDKCDPAGDCHLQVDVDRSSANVLLPKGKGKSRHWWIVVGATLSALIAHFFY